LVFILLLLEFDLAILDLLSIVISGVGVLLLEHHELLLLFEKSLKLLLIELVQELLRQDWHLNQVLATLHHVILKDLLVELSLVLELLMHQILLDLAWLWRHALKTASELLLWELRLRCNLTEFLLGSSLLSVT